MRMSDMEPMLSDTFTIRLSDDEREELRLSELTDRGGNEHYEQFSLLFQGSGYRFLPQSLYEFNHPTIGTEYWLLVPIGKNDEGYIYEAAFNVSKR
jgi:hypothetical protein